MCVCVFNNSWTQSRAMGIKALDLTVTNISFQTDQYTENWIVLQKLCIAKFIFTENKVERWVTGRHSCLGVFHCSAPYGTELKPESLRCEELKIILCNDLYCGSGIRICVS